MLIRKPEKMEWITFQRKMSWMSHWTEIYLLLVRVFDFSVDILHPVDENEDDYEILCYRR